MIKILKNQSGSMIVYLMGLGIVASAAVIYSFNKSESLNKVLRTNKYKQDLVYINGNIKRWVSKDSVCTEMFNGVNFSAGNRYSAITELTSTESGVILQEGQNYGHLGKISLSDISVNKISDTLGDIELSWEILDDGVLGGKTVTRKIPLAYTLTANQITGCYSDGSGLSNAIENFCKGPGATYDSATKTCTLKHMDIPLSCPNDKVPIGVDFDIASSKYSLNCGDPATASLEGNCTSNQVPVGVNNDGTVKCRNLAASDINHLVNGSKANCASGQLKIDSSGGQFRVFCN